MGAGNVRPTAQDYAVFGVLTAQLAPQLQALHHLLSDRTTLLERVNLILRSSGQAEIVPSTAELPIPTAINHDEQQ